ncbi:hypothetical protein V5O48_013751 [Marasmius crinis-equi]|uniref:Uncharacterized protein n=1 Tax=Marasmius crinis-equi TaxID=585013 RepID=A0ABR3EZ81_9AGAR
MSTRDSFPILEPEFQRLELKGILEKEWLQHDLGLSGAALKDAVTRRKFFREETLSRLTNESRVSHLKRDKAEQTRRAGWVPSASAQVLVISRKLRRAQDDWDYAHEQHNMLFDRIRRLSQPAPPNNITRPRRRKSNTLE